MSFRRTLRLNRYLERHLGGTNLEIFKFGLYIMFPIGWMYYFGTNLEAKFAVPDFWPKPGETHRVPFEREEIGNELQRLREKRLRIRDARLRREAAEEEEEDAASTAGSSATGSRSEG